MIFRFVLHLALHLTPCTFCFLGLGLGLELGLGLGEGAVDDLGSAGDLAEEEELGSQRDLRWEAEGGGFL